MYQIYTENFTNTQLDFYTSSQNSGFRWNSFSEALEPEDRQSPKSDIVIGQFFPENDKIQFDL